MNKETIASRLNQELYKLIKYGYLQRILLHDESIFHRFVDEQSIERTKAFQEYQQLQPTVHVRNISSVTNVSTDTFNEMANLVAEFALKSSSNQLDDLIINSSTKSSLDFDHDRKTLHLWSCDGLRQIAFDNYMFDFGTMGYESLVDAMLRLTLSYISRKNKKKYNWFVSLDNYLYMMKDKRVLYSLSSPLKPMVIDDIPITNSEIIREDLNALGLYDSVTTDKTILICVDLTAFVWGIDWNRIQFRSSETDEKIILNVPFRFYMHPDAINQNNPPLLIIHNVPINRR